MTYVDGFILAVPAARLKDYKRIAAVAGEVWMEHGALSYVECVGDEVPYGEITSFPRAVLATDDEVVIFAWITYRSRAERDAINRKVIEDPRLSGDEWTTIFDGKRMIFGGFQAFLEK
ncbi:DUF1428 family protein [Rhizobium sp. TRM95111]|uniref:DUF1428 domain-containing protein n=1 Tax=Rhizobium alarense TaxID=2846851 RepID=UPI001F334E52|nr:DUF1428 family protein [Rhizobium alarense]MCF3641839.1 DUF1428 family protein [Rhizobium alarense]